MLSRNHIQIIILSHPFRLSKFIIPIVGLPDKAVAESKERVRSALHALGLSLPPKRLTVNLAPADLSKEACPVSRVSPRKGPMPSHSRPVVSTAHGEQGITRQNWDATIFG